MSVPENRVCACGAELGDDWTVCRSCAGRLRGLLSDLAGVMDALDGALGRELRFSTSGGRRSSSGRPLAFNSSASEAGWVARQTLLSWVDWIAAVRGHQVPQTWTAVGEYLRESVYWLAQHPTGPEAVDELTAGIRQAIRAIDRPADRRYVGPCPLCAHPVHAAEHALLGRCSWCHAEVEVADLRAATLDRVRSHQLPATEASKLLATLGFELPATQIWQWRRRGQVRSVGVNAKGQPLYRLGDLLRRHAEVPPVAGP